MLTFLRILNICKTFVATNLVAPLSKRFARICRPAAYRILIQENQTIQILVPRPLTPVQFENLKRHLNQIRL